MATKMWKQPDTSKTKLKESRRERLSVVSHFICDQCDEPIISARDGFVIHGNIYVADPSVEGGLIGDNFPAEGTSGEVKKTVMCVKCFFKALGVKTFRPSGDKNGLPQVLEPYRSAYEADRNKKGGLV